MATAPRLTLASVIIGAILSISVPVVASASINSSTAQTGAAQLLTQSSQALLATTNFVIAGYVVENGDNVSISVESADGGDLAMASITSRSSGIGFVGILKTIQIGSQQAYMSGSKSFWLDALRTDKSISKAQTKTVASELALQWVALPANESASLIGSLSSLTQPSRLAKSLLQANGVLHESEPTTFHGQAAIPITSTKSGTFYLALQGSHLPIGVEESSPQLRAEVLFGYPTSLNIAAPANPIAF